MIAHPSFAHAVHVERGNSRMSPEALALDARRAVAGLGLTSGDVGRLLDVDEVTATAVLAGTIRVAPDTAPAARLLELVRLHRALGDVYGSLEQAHRWLDAHEVSLGDQPGTMIRTPDGLRSVVRHLEHHCRDCLG